MNANIAQAARDMDTEHDTMDSEFPRDEKTNTDL